MARRNRWTQILVGMIIIGIGLSGYFIGSGFPDRNANAINDIEVENNMFNVVGPIVYYADYDTVRLIEYQQDTSIQVQELPESLIITPGDYRFKGMIYHLDKEGLYRFIDPQTENQQRIVYNHENPDRLISAIDWIVSHGVADNSMTLDELTEKARNSKLFLTCFPASYWANDLAEMQGLDTRRVGAITREEYNYYDDSHALIEVWNPNYSKWVLYDLDNNAYFWKNRKPLSLIEFANLIDSGDYEIKFLAVDSTVDISAFTIDGFNYEFFSEALYANQDTLRQWYRRVMQIPLQYTSDGYYFYDVENKDRLEALGFIYIDEASFMEMFYGSK
jgi:hypothetical protein